MALSAKATNILADALAKGAADYIFGDERWINLCHEIVPEYITAEVGEVDDDLLYDLALCVMDKIVLKSA